MTAKRARGMDGRVQVGYDDGTRVWLEPSGRPGLHVQIDQEPSPFVITGTWALEPQGLVLAELSVRSRRYEHRRSRGGGLDDLLLPPREIPPVHITGAVLRSLSVSEIERRTREALKRRAEAEAETETYMEQARELGYDLPALFEVPKAARGLLERLGEGSFRPGSQGYPLSLYQWVASEYLALARKGKTRGILPELARRASERLGRDVRAENMRDWVHRARELKLLGPGVRGKAQAHPGSALADAVPKEPARSR